MCRHRGVGDFEEGGSGTGDRGACHDVGFMAGGMAGAEDEGGLHGAKVGVAACHLVGFYIFVADAEAVDDAEPEAAQIVVVDFLQCVMVEVCGAAVGEVGNEVGGFQQEGEPVVEEIFADCCRYGVSAAVEYVGGALAAAVVGEEGCCPAVAPVEGVGELDVAGEVACCAYCVCAVVVVGEGSLGVDVPKWEEVAVVV